MKQRYSISRDAVKRILDKHNLEKLESFISIETGFINPTFLINNSYIIRIDKSDHLKKIEGHNTRFEKEAFLYSLLRKKEIPVPSCLGLDSSGEIIPEKYILTSYIPGVSLSDGFKNLDKKTKIKYLRKWGS